MTPYYFILFLSMLCFIVLFNCQQCQLVVSKFEPQSAEGISVPKKSSLYSYRITLDLATMIFARSHRLNLSTPWFIHCRLDASLQYGKDYFMSEADIFYPEHVTTWQEVATPGILYTRLLVGQTLGSRASGVVIKTKKLLHQLALDSCFELCVFFLWVCNMH